MTNNHFTYSNRGMLLTERSEGCRLAAYQDQVGVWTIGYGHTKDVKRGDTCTQEQAAEWLSDDIDACEIAINRDVRIQLTQNEFDALVDFAFNLGIGALEHSTLWRRLDAGDFARAAAEFPLWDHAGGKTIEGLFERRMAEQELFTSIS